MRKNILARNLFHTLILSLSIAVCLPRAALAIDFYGLASYWDLDDSDSVWGAGLGLSIPLFTEYLRLDSRVYFFESSDINEDNSLDLYPIDMGLQVHILPGEKLDPYITGGISYVYVDSEGIDLDSEFGGYFGAGLDFALTENLILFGELNYRIAELGSDRNFNEDFDVSGMSSNLGLKLHF